MKLKSRIVTWDGNATKIIPINADQSCNVIEIGNYQINIQFEITQKNKSTYICQKINGHSISGRDENIGIRIENSLEFEADGNGGWRFCIPTLVYTMPQKLKEGKLTTFMEDRLSANMVIAYDETKKSGLSFVKKNCARNVERPMREKGQNHYLHKTENGYIGYCTDENRINFHFGWPYKEEEKSVAISITEKPIYAYYPLDGKDFEISLLYESKNYEANTYTDALYEEFKNLGEWFEEKEQAVVNLPFSLEKAREYRFTSLKRSYRDFGEDGAGFFFHFDPLYGYQSDPSGFSTSFNTIPHASYQHILEYGFTGREINAAWNTAKEYGKEWLIRGEKVINFFLKNCTTENGWVFSLYDLEKGTPFYSCGDPEAPKLHYISRKREKGNYLRTMVEPMNDVFEAFVFYDSIGIRHTEWLEKVAKFAEFLLNKQNKDGSWYRAYQQNGLMADVGGDEELSEIQKIEGRKAATAIPLIFLTNIYDYFTGQGKDADQYLESAKKAGDYVLEHIVSLEHYQGGTLDNPNVVDKEAAQYAMAGLYHLYIATREKRYLQGSIMAAKQFVTWNYIWNAPVLENTILCEKKFKTKGCGGINSIWGGGVVDIYSLFHIGELYLIGKETEDDFMCQMADWIAKGTQQIMSYPDDTMGFTDDGMQPEGFGICPQGVDDGQIDKGDIWGSLGWIYSAGIYGLGNYLKLKKDESLSNY